MVFSIPIHADQVLKTENTENGGAGRIGEFGGNCFRSRSQWLLCTAL